MNSFWVLMKFGRVGVVGVGFVTGCDCNAFLLLLCFCTKNCCAVLFGVGFVVYKMINNKTKTKSAALIGDSKLIRKQNRLGRKINHNKQTQNLFENDGVWFYLKF